MTRKTTLAALAAVAATALAIPTVGVADGPTAKAAKNVTITLDGKTNLEAQTSAGKVTGTLGRGTYSAKLNLAKQTSAWTLKVPGGQLRITGTTKLSKGTLIGNWRVTGGSGKYRGASGKGTLSAKSLGGALVLKGSIK